MDLTLDRKNTLTHARQILDAARAANRELSPSEQASVEADMERVKELDHQIKGHNLGSTPPVSRAPRRPSWAAAEQVAVPPCR